MDKIDVVSMDELSAATAMITHMNRYSAALISNNDYNIRSKIEGFTE